MKAIEKLKELAASMNEHSNKHINLEDYKAAAIEGICADRLAALIPEVEAEIAVLQQGDEQRVRDISRLTVERDKARDEAEGK